MEAFRSLSCGLVAGVFFTFSTFVISALARLEPPQGIVAMQSIHITVINPLFMGLFMGTALLCLSVISSLLKWHRPGAPYQPALSGRHFWSNGCVQRAFE